MTRISEIKKRLEDESLYAHHKAMEDLTYLIRQVEGRDEQLRLAVKYLKEGKAKYAPNTTNSFVDDFIADYERKALLECDESGGVE